MSRPTTRSMTRPMAQKTKHTELSLTAPEEEYQVCREPNSLKTSLYLFLFCQTFRFLFLPDEVRNMIYRDLVGPKFHDDKIISLSIFKSQPAITRVNKQIRAESLSIYYAENKFWMAVSITHFHRAVLHVRAINHIKFCDNIKRFIPARARVAGVQTSLHHIRDFRAEIYIENYSSGQNAAIFEKVPDISVWRGTEWRRQTAHRLGGDETDWADRSSVRELIAEWTGAIPHAFRSPGTLQNYLSYVLWLLGVNLTSDSTTLVSAFWCC